MLISYVSVSFEQFRMEPFLGELLELSDFVDFGHLGNFDELEFAARVHHL